MSNQFHPSSKDLQEIEDQMSIEMMRTPEAQAMFAALLAGQVDQFNTLRKQHPQVTSIGNTDGKGRLANYLLRGLDLTGMTVWLSTIDECTFVACNLEDWTLEDCVVNNSVFEDCTLKDGSWANATFRNCTFGRCKLAGRMVHNATFEQCTFIHSSIARLRGTRDANWRVVSLGSNEQRDILLRKLRPDICVRKR